jgi:hypothetical protein
VGESAYSSTVSGDNAGSRFALADDGAAYTGINGVNPRGEGNLQLKDTSGGAQGIRQARGCVLFNANGVRRRTSRCRRTRTIGFFVELYNLTVLANFGNAIGNNAASATTYLKSNGYIGGIGAVSTIPNSFQTQVGARFSF